MFMAPLSTIAKLQEEPKCSSTDEWIKKVWCIYTIEYYLAIKKNEILPFTTMWMELESIMLSEISQQRKIVGDCREKRNLQLFYNLHNSLS